MAREQATLKQIAEAVGVSMATASRALNGKWRDYRISEETALAVQEAARKLKFSPNRVAQSLRSQRTNSIGVLVPDIGNPFFAAIAREVTRLARKRGYAVLLAESLEQTPAEEEILQHLLARRIEGLLICPVGASLAHLEPLVHGDMPAVQVDRCILDLELTSVTSDHREGARHAMETLIGQGHTQIGCLQGQPGTLPNEERLAGCREAFKKAKLPFDEEWILGEDFGKDSGLRAASRLLGERPEVSALFAFSNQIALGALEAARVLGRTIPDDLSLIAFDESPYAPFLATPLSTVRQDVAGLGRIAADALFDQIDSTSRARLKRYRVPTELIVRASIGPWRKRRESARK
ncbi:LacI family DNA-binding transcriptional regulator [Planctomycetes bacterium Pan216]